MPLPEELIADLPEDLRGLETLRDINSLEDLIKTNDSAQRMLGNSVRIPSQDAGEEDWNKFWDKFNDVPGVARVPDDPNGDWSDVLKKMGMPDDPGAYEVDDADLKTLMHSAGLTKKQAKALGEKLTTYNQTSKRQELERVQSGMSQLKEDWGEGFDRMMHNVQQFAAQIDKANGNSHATDILNKTRLGQDPDVIRLVAGMSKVMSEPGLNQGDYRSSAFGYTKDEAMMRAAEIENMEQYKSGLPLDHPLMRERDRMYKIAYPD